MGDSSWLKVSECFLFLCGALLTIGLIGEYLGLEMLDKWKKVFAVLVIVGVAGELLADGGILHFTQRLQSATDLQVACLNKRAAEAEQGAAQTNSDLSVTKEKLQAVTKTLEVVLHNSDPKTVTGLAKSVLPTVDNIADESFRRQALRFSDEVKKFLADRATGENTGPPSPELQVDRKYESILLSYRKQTNQMFVEQFGSRCVLIMQGFTLRGIDVTHVEPFCSSPGLDINSVRAVAGSVRTFADKLQGSD